MYLLYLDESGNDPKSNYFVLAGVAVFERQTYWVSDELDRIVRSTFPNKDAHISLHASEIRAGRQSPWDDLDRELRYKVLDQVYEAIVQSQTVLFAEAIQRTMVASGEEYPRAFESLVKRFDDFLANKYHETGERERGLVIVAASQLQQPLEQVAIRLGREGTRWGNLRNLAEIPLFTMARNSRLLQVADFVANAVWGRYESGLTRNFDKLASKFYQYGGIFHGLGHYTDSYLTCTCPGCLTRRLNRSIG